MKSPEIVQYASEQISTRLGKLAFQVATAAKGGNGEAVHDLRVAVRRFDQSLTVFASLIPENVVKKIRGRLRRIRKAAGQVRDRDIALEFLDESGLDQDSELWTRIASERKVAEKSLARDLKRWNDSNLSRKWRADLEPNFP